MRLPPPKPKSTVRLLIFLLFLSACGTRAGVTVSNIYSFPSPFPNGINSSAALVLGNDNNFYGVTQNGGSNGVGLMFRITSGGTLTPLYSFTGGSDGANPSAGMILATNGDFYGTTQNGGSNGLGTVFKITSAGVLTPLYSFQGSVDGANPIASLVLGSNGLFYGVCQNSGTNGFGSIFKITAAGVLTPLYFFTNQTEGATPCAALIQGTNGIFYGTTQNGGPGGWGTIFQITASGNFQSLYPFQNGSDGANPVSSLVQGNDGDFYGTAEESGDNGYGTIFSMTATGVVTPLYQFMEDNDGAYPTGALILGGNGNFFGTTFGSSDDGYYGSIFQITSGGTLTPMYAFKDGSDGSFPYAPLIHGPDGPYGTTMGDGVTNYGSVFKLLSGLTFQRLFTFQQSTASYFPNAGLVAGTDGNLYGTTQGDDVLNYGSVFKITTAGTNTFLYEFTNGIDGASPASTLAQGMDGNFYGTCTNGGSNNLGTVFKITPVGKLTALYSFTGGSDGANPGAGLILGKNQNFYGVCQAGGSKGLGTVFEITSAGALTPLYSFTGGSDGANPYAPLLLASDENFYGTATEAGDANAGAIFSMTPGGVVTPFYSFAGGGDGATPYAALTEGTDGNFYGSLANGGSDAAEGGLFSITPSGVLTSLYLFMGEADGGYPMGAMSQAADGNFYGTALYGGSQNLGELYSVSPGGTFTPIYSFTGGAGGAFPTGPMALATNGSFYGTTCGADLLGNTATNGWGTVFKLTVNYIPPPSFLSVTENAGHANFLWTTQTNQKYQLQFSTTMFTTNWTNIGTMQTASGNTMAGSDTSATNRYRFYRVVLLP